MFVKKNELILMSQSHSSKVVVISKNNYKKKIHSDAMITKIKGLALGVVTADCVPIIIYDFNNEIVGCIHAGWKGAFSGIIKNTVYKIKELNSKNKIYASIGPCIGKKNYEVNLSFYKKFLNKSKKNKKYFSYKNRSKKNFDLRKFVSDRLIELKVKVDHVNHDTFKEKTKFFSYRRSCKLKQNDYGRCLSAVRLI
jgi:YfiH family protein